MKKIVGPYKKPRATFHPYDNRFPLVADHLKKLIELYMADVTIEHIGSTAIPGCPGKGIIDLMALYPNGHLDIVNKVLSAMGFQRQGKEFKNRFPDSRPVMMGTLKYGDSSFLVYVHIIHEASYEAVRFRIFRDRLCDDSELLSAYIAEKKRIILEGVTDTDTYAELKRPIMQRILGNDYDEKNHSKV